ncbi:hypothetical protein BV20DRAFT_1035984 [Pilatotrama ljubarskyi]|nr:hypothetical protein BV20DRAFT_1035984 [Pilatotrama ljubarskyi]
MRAPKVDIKQREQVRKAKKKAEMKAAARAPQAEWSFVYVGNLSSSTTDEQLRALFQPCGAIRRIQIRASGGVCVPTANLPSRGFFGFGGVDEGIHYATVEYLTPASARQALELTGTELDGRRILVSFSVGDLPETSDIIKSHIRKKDPHLEKRALWKAKFGQLKRLTIERTEVVSDGEQPLSGPAKLIEDVATRLGLYVPAAHQNGARHPLAQQITFPKTLV